MRKKSVLRRKRKPPFIFVLVLFPTLIIAAPIASAQRFPGQGEPTIPGTRQLENFSVSGWVSDAANHGRIDNVQVQLRAVTGGIVGSTFTRGNGDFEFDNIPQGSYTLVAEEPGYEPISQQVDVTYGSVFGLEVEMRKAGDADAVGPGAKKTVSVRELSIPRKAHESMEKGMALLYGKSDFQGSIKQFEKAIDQYPGYYEAYAQIGIAYLRMGDKTKSEEALRKSLEVSQNRYADGFSMLADLLSSSDRYSEAEPLARKAVELDQQSWQANSELARALLGLNRPQEAEVEAATAVKQNPKDPLLYLLLADVHIKLANYPAIVADLDNYLKIAPNGQFADKARKQRDEIQQELNARKVSGPNPTPASSKP